MSSYQPSPIEDERFSAEPPKSRGGRNLLLGFGIGCGIVAVLCCGGFGLVGYFGYRMVADALIEDPQQIRTVTAELVQMQIPADFEPQMGFRMQVPFTDESMTSVIYTLHDEEGALVLASMGGMPVQEGQILDAIEQQLMQQQALGGENPAPDRDRMTVTESETREFVIRDEPARFVFSRGTTHDGEEVYQVYGAFEGEPGTVLMLVFVHAHAMSEEQIAEMIESIR